jgi:hypothetical protein
MHFNNQNPQPKIVLKPIIKLKLKEPPTDTEIKEVQIKVKEVKVKDQVHPEPTIKRKSNTNKTKIKLKQVSIDNIVDNIDITCSDIDSIDDASCSSSSSAISIASELTTYIVPVYGIDMRMSFDNKFIYDMEFNHVGTVTDSKSIDWID